MSNKCSNPISRTQNARKLVTATGDEINMVAEVVSHEFIVASPLVEDCILGMDFLAKHRVDINFELKTIKDRTLGTVMFDNPSFYRESKFTSNNISPLHSEHYFEETTVNSSDVGDSDDWECRGVVPDYRNTLVYELPIVEDDFMDIIN